MDFCRPVAWGNNGGPIGDSVEMVEVGSLTAKLPVISSEDGADKSGTGSLPHIAPWSPSGATLELIAASSPDNDGLGSVCVIAALRADNTGVSGNGLPAARSAVDFEEAFGEPGRSTAEADARSPPHTAPGSGSASTFGLIGLVDNVGSDSVAASDSAPHAFSTKSGNPNAFSPAGLFVLPVSSNVALLGPAGVGRAPHGLLGSIVVSGFAGGLAGVDHAGIAHGSSMIWL